MDIIFRDFFICIIINNLNAYFSSFYEKKKTNKKNPNQQNKTLVGKT